jgi:AmmeMemoRadiSam system protein A
MLLPPQHHRTLLDAARAVIRGTLAGRPIPQPQTAEPALLQPAGCFVSLHEKVTHRLRGCVGRMDATAPLITAVCKASSGVLNDPRFRDHDAVHLYQLPSLDLEISILSPMRPAPGPMEFDLLNDGIYLKLGGRSGVFLPQVARETGWTKEQLLSRLCTEKMGLPPDAWQLPGAQLLIFSTQIVGPEGFDESAPMANP